MRPLSLEAAVSDLIKRVRDRSLRDTIARDAYRAFRKVIEPTLVRPWFSRIDWKNVGPETHEAWVARGVVTSTLIVVADGIRSRSRKLSASGDKHGAKLLDELSAEIRKLSES